MPTKSPFNKDKCVQMFKGIFSQLILCKEAIELNHVNISMVSCQKGPTRHAYAWQVGPFWQDTLDMWIVIPCMDGWRPHFIRRWNNVTQMQMNAHIGIKNANYDELHWILPLSYSQPYHAYNAWVIQLIPHCFLKMTINKHSFNTSSATLLYDSIYPMTF